MHTNTTIKLSDNLAVKALVKALDPSYRKHNIVMIATSEPVTLRQPAWDGGSRTMYVPATLDGTHLPTPLVSNPWPERPAEATFELATTTCVFTHGSFRGKTAIMRLYVTPATHDWLIDG